jgi:organic radical activating enzyme
MVKSKKSDETFLQYKQRVLDTKSASFCGAKWYNATVWLGSGQTTSCHHPLPHKVSAEQVTINPRALHNTVQKKTERLMMTQGQRPAGCEYCWRIEDNSPTAISDRPYKSMIYSEKELSDAFADPHSDVNLRTLEIAFDRTCNFACSYCNPAFSTTWVKDIKQNGAYTNLTSDGRNHYTHEHSASQLYALDETNPYVEAFFRWWDTDLHKTLRELRITGGEPLMSPHIWRLFEWFKQNKSDVRLAINSNLGAKPDLIDRLIKATHDIDNMEIYTSCEATGLAAEWIRDGLVYTDYIHNIHNLLTNGNVKSFHMMCTINGLCLPTLPDFLEQCMDFKRQYGKSKPTFTLNILRFPSFQSPVVMPAEIKQQCCLRLQEFLDTYAHSDLLHEMEQEHVKRLIEYLNTVTTPHNNSSDSMTLDRDLRTFILQYDRRRDKDFMAAFPLLTEWYHEVQL